MDLHAALASNLDATGSKNWTLLAPEERSHVCSGRKQNPCVHVSPKADSLILLRKLEMILPEIARPRGEALDRVSLNFWFGSSFRNCAEMLVQLWRWVLPRVLPRQWPFFTPQTPRRIGGFNARGVSRNGRGRADCFFGGNVSPRGVQCFGEIWAEAFYPGFGCHSVA